MWPVIVVFAALGSVALALGASVDTRLPVPSFDPSLTCLTRKASRYHFKGRFDAFSVLNSPRSNAARDDCDSPCSRRDNGDAYAEMSNGYVNSGDTKLTDARPTNSMTEANGVALDTSLGEKGYYICSTDRTGVLICNYGFCSTDHYCGNDKECSDDSASCETHPSSTQPGELAAGFLGRAVESVLHNLAARARGSN